MADRAAREILSDLTAERDALRARVAELEGKLALCERAENWALRFPFPVAAIDMLEAENVKLLRVAELAHALMDWVDHERDRDAKGTGAFVRDGDLEDLRHALADAGMEVKDG